MSGHFKSLLVLALFVLVNVGAWAQSPSPAKSTTRLNEQEWLESTPALLRVNPQKLTALEQHVRADQPAIRSLLIVRDGAIAYEYYRAGVGPQTLHNVYSVTKSVVSLLVGAALHEGLIRSTEEKLLDFFPDAKTWPLDAATAQITLAHMLTLTPGFDRGGLDQLTDYNDFVRRFYAPDLLQHALSRRVAHAPGSQFHYSNLDSHLLSFALARRVKTNLVSYAQDKLFTPLGITDFHWPTNALGEANGAAELNLRSRDMAKLGQLVLQQGRWKDRQLVSANYLAAATRRQGASNITPPRRPDLWGYGYLWWTASTPGDDLPSFYAVGYGGQYIYVVPALNAVVVATTDAQSRATAAKTGAVIRDYALPAIER